MEQADAGGADVEGGAEELEPRHVGRRGPGRHVPLFWGEQGGGEEGDARG